MINNTLDILKDKMWTVESTHYFGDQIYTNKGATNVLLRAGNEGKR